MPEQFTDVVKDAATKAPSTGFQVQEQYREFSEYYTKRKNQLMQSRKNIKGKDIDALINDVEKNYQPHKVTVKSPRTIDNSQPNLYIKVATAMSIVLNRSFDATLSPALNKYRKTNELMRGLYLHSLDPQVSSTRQQYINAAFNMMMYGWGDLRTYRKYIEKFRYGPDGKTRETYVEKDEVDAEVLHPKDVWIDDMARPGDRDSINDWLRRKIYDFRTFKREFPEKIYPNSKYVLPGGDTALHVATEGNATAGGESTLRENEMVEVYFYENEAEDGYVIEANNIPFHISPMPTRNHKLTLSHGIWSLRSTDTIYGIGVWEIIEQDQQLIDMVRDMSIEQLVLSIFSMVFHDGTNKLEGDRIVTEAGKWVKLLNPDKVKQFQLNGPDQNVINFIAKFQQDLDDACGISKVLTGESLGKTAFEANLNQEAGLRRLKTPAENIKEFIEWEGSNRIAMIQQIYSIPKVIQLTDPADIIAYQKEMEAENGGQVDPEAYKVDENNNFFKFEWREVPMNIKKDENGYFGPSDETTFFKIKPAFLEWKGTIQIKIESLILGSEELRKSKKLELSRFVGPFIDRMAQQPGSAIYYVPFLIPIIKAYNEDPDEWIPLAFMNTYKEDLPNEQQKAEELNKQNAGSMDQTAKSPRAAFPTADGSAMPLDNGQNDNANPAAPMPGLPGQAPIQPVQQLTPTA